MLDRSFLLESFFDFALIFVILVLVLYRFDILNLVGFANSLALKLLTLFFKIVKEKLRTVLFEVKVMCINYRVIGKKQLKALLLFVGKLRYDFYYVLSIDCHGFFVFG